MRFPDDHPPGGIVPVGESADATVLVAVGCARVREGLVAMLGTLDGFRVVAEADTDEAAIEAARVEHPQLALVDPELSGCGGWWAMQEMQNEHLAGAIVALGRRADADLARVLGVRTYLQMGTSPRDLLSALRAAVAFCATSGATQAEHHLLADTYPVLNEPALVDL